jgi:hypothetical protein
MHQPCVLVAFCAILYDCSILTSFWCRLLFGLVSFCRPHIHLCVLNINNNLVKYINVNYKNYQVMQYIINISSLSFVKEMSTLNVITESCDKR